MCEETTACVVCISCGVVYGGTYVMKICLVGAEFYMRTDGQVDGHDRSNRQFS
jgi:hypothetical protein